MWKPKDTYTPSACGCSIETKNHETRGFPLREMNTQKFILCAGALALALNMSGCYSFSLFQSARMLPPGYGSITPSLSRLATIDGRDLDYTDRFSVADLQIRYGLEKWEMGYRISRINLEDGYQFLSFDPKIPIVRDRLAFLLPTGFFFGENIDSMESIQIHPAFIASIPFGNSKQLLNLALKGIVPLDEPADHFTGINIGFSLADEETAGMTVHPEIGLFTDPGGNYYFHWGMGLSFSRQN